MFGLVGYIGSAVIVLLFVAGVWAMSSGAHGDWVREFYAKRNRLQTLFGNKRDGDQKSN